MRISLLSAVIRQSLFFMICLLALRAEAQWIDCTGQAAGTTTCTTRKVGIGNSTGADFPSFSLHVESTLAATLARIRNLSTSGGVLDLVTAASGTQQVLLARGGDGSIFTLSALANGYVGIGTTTPTLGQLHISGNSNGATSRPRIGLEDLAGSGQWLLQPWVNAGDGNFQILRLAGSGNLSVPSGNVGIGTTTPQRNVAIVGSGSATLQVADSTQGTAVGDGFQLQQIGVNSHLINEENGSLALWTNATQRLTIDASGRVGIGTSTPSATSTLDVAGAVNGTGLTINGMQNSNTRFQQANNLLQSGLFVVGSDYLTTSGAYLILNRQSGLGSYGSIQVGDNGSYQGLALNPGGGNVGIGTISPSQKLHVVGQYSEVEFNGDVASGSTTFLAHSRGTNAAPANVIVNDYAGTLLFGAHAGGSYRNAGRIDSLVTATSTASVDSALVFSAASTASGGNFEAMRVSASGSVGINTSSPNPAYKLDVNGAIRATSVIGAVYQDLAEWVPAGESMSPGTVVVLNPDRTNEVIPSSHAYDTSVAGVVSEKPGILLGEASDQKAKIATTGRVRVRVDATSAPIRVGDLLVTSDKLGTAMKSEPMEINGRRFHQPGTIVGKALEPLNEGRGEILVLLSLQ